MSIEGVNNNLSYQATNSRQTPEAVNTTEQNTTGEKENTVTVTGSPKGNQSDSQNNEAIKKAVEQINKKMNNTECRFGIHEATNRVMIKIVDKDTDKVIKEFPPEETLDIIAKVLELAGILVDEKR